MTNDSANRRQPRNRKWLLLAVAATGAFAGLAMAAQPAPYTAATKCCARVKLGTATVSWKNWQTGTGE